MDKRPGGSRCHVKYLLVPIHEYSHRFPLGRLRAPEIKDLRFVLFDRRQNGALTMQGVILRYHDPFSRCDERHPFVVRCVVLEKRFPTTLGLDTDFRAVNMVVVDIFQSQQSQCLWDRRTNAPIEIQNSGFSQSRSTLLNCDSLEFKCLPNIRLRDNKVLRDVVDGLSCGVSPSERPCRDTLNGRSTE